MNVDTGELRRMRSKEDELELIKQGFDPVPKRHRKEVAKELGDKQSTIVDMKKDTPLTKWANKERAKKKKRVAKIAKASRRRNQI